jgi:hypothetical protein
MDLDVHYLRGSVLYQWSPARIGSGDAVSSREEWFDGAECSQGILGGKIRHAIPPDAIYVGPTCVCVYVRACISSLFYS